MQSAQEYGSIILKNVNHIEKLINDLKLTYQLDSGTIPYKPQEVLLTRYLKELTIEIVNDPAFSARDIAFESSAPELTVSIKPSSGSIRLNRKSIQDLGEQYYTHLGYMPQDFGFYSDFIAREFILYIAAVKGLDKKKAVSRTKELLHMVNLHDVAGKYLQEIQALVSIYRTATPI